MQYYTFELNEESHDLYIIITLFGKYKYKCLPMGLKCTLDFVQQIMEEFLYGLDNLEVNFENIGLFANMWEELLLQHNKFFSCLEANSFTDNPLECKWAVQEADWFSYWLMPTSCKPWKNCFSAILEQELHCNLKKICGYIGAINAYHLM